MPPAAGREGAVGSFPDLATALGSPLFYSREIGREISLPPGLRSPTPMAAEDRARFEQTDWLSDLPKSNSPREWDKQQRAEREKAEVEEEKAADEEARSTDAKPLVHEAGSETPEKTNERFTSPPRQRDFPETV